MASYKRTYCLRLIRACLDVPAWNPDEILETNRAGYMFTALDFAVAFDNADLTRRIVNRGANMLGGDPRVPAVIRCRSLDVLTALFCTGPIDINATDNRGGTVLTASISAFNDGMCDVEYLLGLLHRGANVGGDPDFTATVSVLRELKTVAETSAKIVAETSAQHLAFKKNLPMAIACMAEAAKHGRNM
jgi:hypothetical protein